MNTVQIVTAAKEMVLIVFSRLFIVQQVRW
jgi:hypothetical protein